LTIVVNAASFVLFPIAVVGSQGSFSTFFRFAFGHAISVILSSAFSFLAIFALSGTLMACLPYRIFRKVSVYVRFAVALCLLTVCSGLRGTGPSCCRTDRKCRLPSGHFFRCTTPRCSTPIHPVYPELLSPRGNSLGLRSPFGFACQLGFQALDRAWRRTASPSRQENTPHIFSWLDCAPVFSLLSTFVGMAYRAAANSSSHCLLW